MSFAPLKVDIQQASLLDDVFAHPSISPDSNSTPTQQHARRTSNVFSRLQALFPHSASASTTTVNAVAPEVPHKKHAPPPPEPFIKVRIMSWNMHDSLPKGELDELLGVVPPYTPSSTSANNTTLPLLAADSKHPYHIVVIAGQECPSSSAIPKGLSAGFRSKEKQQERERHREKAKEREAVSGGRGWSIEEDREAAQHAGASGWSYIIEDWHRYGTNTEHSSPNPPSFDLLSPPKSPGPGSAAPKSSPPLPPPGNTNAENRQGPYVLLTKERLMGIYMAVYVHRDARSLVKGHSKASVTTGLIGGRMGNKGGVGISLKMQDTTFLFINAHLAAHEGKVPHRIANLAKIKSELAVDDFLEPNDPRQMKEDLTDRFDQCFVFGDLNFRLDVTRLHADWLISRKEYEQALAFDQLRNIMRNGQSLVGFHEAPIDFPPTFKYDVLRTLKHKSKREKPADLPEQGLDGVEEHDEEGGGAEDDDSDGEAADSTSVASTSRTSSRSKQTVHDTEDEDYFSGASSLPSTPNMPISVPGVIPSKALVSGVYKAKSKWMALLTAGSAASTPTGTRPSLSISTKRANTGLGHPHLGSFLPPPSPRFPSDPVTPLVKPIKSAALAFARGTSIKSGRSGRENDDDVGVYDSSSKQRVPSWCDRILWKTGVLPTEDERPRGSRMSTLLAQVIRRSRHNSLASSIERDSVSTQTDTHSSTSHTSTPAASPVLAPKPRLAKSQSADPLPSSSSEPTSPSLDRTLSQSPTLVPSLVAEALVDELELTGTPSRRGSTGIPLVQTQTLPVPSAPSPRRRSTGQSQDSTTSHHSWMRFFQFGNRASTASVVSERPSTPESVLSAPRHRKGDVVCLYYDTLDDRGMRRLEGRSDHRPVMGSFAVYI